LNLKGLLWQLYPDLMNNRVKFKKGVVDGYSIVYPSGDRLEVYELHIRKELYN